MGQSASQGRNIAADDGNDPDPSYTPSLQDDPNHRPQAKGSDRRLHRRSHTSNSAAEDGWASGSASEESEADADTRGLHNALDPINGDHVNYLPNTHASNIVNATVGLHSTYITSPSRRPTPGGSRPTPRFQFGSSSFNTDGSSSASERDNNASTSDSTTGNAAGGGRLFDNPSLLEKGLAGNSPTTPTKTSHFPLFRGFLKGNGRVNHEERPSFSFTPVPLNFHNPARPYTAEQLATRPPLLPTPSTTAPRSRERAEEVGDHRREGSERWNAGGNVRVDEGRPSSRSSGTSDESLSTGIAALAIQDNGGVDEQTQASSNVSSPVSSSSFTQQPIRHSTGNSSSTTKSPIPKRTKRDLESTLASPAARNRDMRGRWSADSMSTSSCARSQSPRSKLPRYSANNPGHCTVTNPPETVPQTNTRRNVESVDGDTAPSDTSASSSMKRPGDRLSRRRRLSVELPESPASFSTPARPVNPTRAQQPILDPAVVNMTFDFAVEEEDSDDILTSAKSTSIPRSGDIIDIDRSDDERRYQINDSHVLNLPRLLDDSEDLLRKQLRRREHQRNRQSMSQQQQRVGNGSSNGERLGQPVQGISRRDTLARSSKETVPSKRAQGRAAGTNSKSMAAPEAKIGSMSTASQPNATGAPNCRSDESTAGTAKQGKARTTPTPPPIPATSNTAGSPVNQKTAKSMTALLLEQQLESMRNETNLPGPPPSPPSAQPNKDPVTKTAVAAKTAKGQPENRTGGKGPISTAGKPAESKNGSLRKPNVDDGAPTASKSKANTTDNAVPNPDPSPSAAQGASVKGGKKRSGNKKSSTESAETAATSEPQGTYIGKGPRAPFSLRRRRFLTIKPTDWVCAFCDYEHSLWLESEYPRIQRSIKKKVWLTENDLL